MLTLALYCPDEESDPATAQDLAGVAVVIEEPDGTGVLEIAVHPSYRNQGVADRLVGELRDTRGFAGLKAWSHGNHEAAADLAARYGYGPVRELWKMRLTSAAAELPDVPLPDGVALRAFVPGRDEDAWLAANRAAFAHHAEQGNMTRADLDARMAEPWFDPAGFLLAVDASDRILGFHWTKVHPRHGDHPAIGEVYVVGVTPEAQGTGPGESTDRGRHPAPAAPGPARRHALRRCGQHSGRFAVPAAGLHPLGCRRHVCPIGRALIQSADICCPAAGNLRLFESCSQADCL